MEWAEESGPHHAQHREEDDDGQAGIGTVGAGVDVRVPFLVQLQHAESSNHVHERCVWVRDMNERQ